MPGSSSIPAAAASSTSTGGMSRSSSAAICPARSATMSRKRSQSAALNCCSRTSDRCRVWSRSWTTAVTRPGRTDTAPTAPPRACHAAQPQLLTVQRGVLQRLEPRLPPPAPREGTPTRHRQGAERPRTVRRAPFVRTPRTVPLVPLVPLRIHRFVPSEHVHRSLPRSATRSASSASVSSVSAASPDPSTASANCCLRESISAIRSSIVPSVMNRWTCTGWVCPMR